MVVHLDVGDEASGASAEKPRSARRARQARGRSILKNAGSNQSLREFTPELNISLYWSKYNGGFSAEGLRKKFKITNRIKLAQW